MLAFILKSWYDIRHWNFSFGEAVMEKRGGLFSPVDYRVLSIISYEMLLTKLQKTAAFIAACMMGRVFRWGGVAGKVQMEDISNYLVQFHDISSRTTIHRSMDQVKTSNLFIFSSDTDYTVNLPGILSYYFSYTMLKGSKLNFFNSLWGKVIATYDDKAIACDIPIFGGVSNMKLDELVEDARAKSIASKKPVTGNALTVTGFITAMKALSSKHNRGFNAIKEPRTFKKVKNYLAECIKEERDPIDTIDNTIPYWNGIVTFLIDITGYTSIQSITFDFETFYNFRGYVYDYLSVREGGEGIRASERIVGGIFLKRLLDAGRRPVAGKDHRIEIKGLDSMLTSIEAGGPVVVGPSVDLPVTETPSMWLKSGKTLKTLKEERAKEKR